MKVNEAVILYLNRPTFLLFIIFYNLTLFGQEYKRLENEKAEDFAKRIKPNNKATTSKLADKAVETKLWDNSTNIIFAFYNMHIDYIKEEDCEDCEDEEMPYESGYGYAFVEIKSNIYQSVFIGQIGWYFDSTFKVESIFFANADRDQENELMILTSKKFNEEGKYTFYCTHFFDNINFQNLPHEMYSLSDYDYGQYFYSTEGIEKKGESYQIAKYKTASAVKKRLKELRHERGYDFSYPILKKNGKSLNEFIPKGWILLDSASGDLNNDRTQDITIIIQHKDSVNILEKHDNYTDTIETQPRVLVILFKEKLTDKYVLAEQSNNFILNHTNPNMDDPYSDIKINKEVLEVNFNFWSSWGSWSTSSNSYKFRYQNNDFYLIGEEYTSHARNTEDFVYESYNYLTKMMRRTLETNGSKPKVEWHKIEGEIKTLKTITHN